ncbi:hypothetical protein NUH16_006291 [Penicillium rubens]|uniref:uncharacterized protein n=1 Tax=Penicillium rubens TaxID=1108849 RepID=UPI002A59B358|nr:uncharacterized protein N7525_009107 [Penicillium rubens]KAJ5047795.1 hypothetical protein NUH16_006291 [Penicillium rubens]KAJ5830854.1 hypothetical protein N7525_009107 [Penicillium rubens]
MEFERNLKTIKASYTTCPAVDELWTMVKITPSGGEEVWMGAPSEQSSSFLDLLLACLAWFEMFWSNTAGGYGASLDSFDDDETTAFMLPEDFVAAVSEAVRHLIASFDNFVKSHRRTHGLTGAHVSRVRVLVPVFFF